MPRGRGYSQGRAPRGLRPHLDVVLKSGCRLDRASGRLVSPDGRPVAATESLPRGSELVPVVPHLADLDPAGLSPAERDLARRVKIVLPAGTDPTAVLARVRRWRCVEEVRMPPEISLP
jgi:hypothetical protein